MADLIEREYGTKRLENEYCKTCTRRGKYEIFGAACTPCWVMDCIEEFENAPAAFRWIPVEDALPEKDKSYITYAETTKYCNHNELPEESRINILYFNGEEWYDDECIYYNVTHYMPMPEPPESEVRNG